MVVVKPNLKSDLKLAEKFRDTGSGTTVEQLAYIKQLLNKHDGQFNFTREVKPKSPQSRLGRIFARFSNAEKLVEKISAAYEPEEAVEPETIRFELTRSLGENKSEYREVVFINASDGTMLLCEISKASGTERVYCEMDDSLTHPHLVSKMDLVDASRRKRKDRDSLLLAEGCKVGILSRVLRADKAQSSAHS